MSRHWLDIAIAAHYLTGPDSLTPDMENLLARFPNWTVPIGWTCNYKHYRL